MTNTLIYTICWIKSTIYYIGVGNVRFSLSKNNNITEIDEVVRQLIKIVLKLKK